MKGRRSRSFGLIKVGKERDKFGKWQYLASFSIQAQKHLPVLVDHFEIVECDPRRCTDDDPVPLALC